MLQLVILSRPSLKVQTVGAVPSNRFCCSIGQFCKQAVPLGEGVLNLGKALRMRFSMEANYGTVNRARALIQLALSLRTCKI